MNGFHNPYNFVPAIDRDPHDAELGDREPAGHDRLHHQLWTGTLRVTMKTVAPMLIPDEGTDNGGHRTVGTRVTDVDGHQHVHLPSTTVKGALRSAYEAVTNSRMGVFDRPDPLGYRPDARSGVGEPVLVRLDADGEPIGALSCVKLGHRDHRQILDGVAIPAYDNGSVPPVTLPGGGPHHGDKISAWVELVEHQPREGTRQRPYVYWRAVTIWRSGVDPDPLRPNTLGTAERSTRAHVVLGPGALARGIVHRTNRNIQGKHDERLFLTVCSEHDQGVEVRPSKRLSLAEDAWSAYQNLIADYRAQHHTERRDDIWRRGDPDARPWDTYQSRGKTIYAWSRHLYDTTDTTQGPNPQQPETTLTGYGVLDGDKITRLYPVLISRSLHARSPSALLPANVAAAESLAQLSPADRVFGWVRMSPRDDTEDSDAAVAGALRVGPVRGPRADEALEQLGTGIPLDILSAPKPSQGRFYTAKKSDDALPAPLARGTEKKDFFAKGTVLRGRKVYPHQPEPRPDYWNPGTTGQEFRRPGGTCDDQNRTVINWVRCGQTFSFDLHMRNVSDVELGALLLLLDPDRYGRDGKPGRHRVGGGKPLGFGSVELRLAEAGHDLRRGAAWLRDFTTLGTAPATEDGDIEWREQAARFESAMTKTADGGKLLDAVRESAVGYPVGQPVHYPRLTPAKDPNGENYRWFVQNERPRPVGGNGRPAKDAAALPPIGTQLPYDTSPPRDRPGGANHDRRRQQR